MRVVTLGLVAWLIGLGAYTLALFLMDGEWMSRGDLRAIASVSLIAFALCYGVVYVPALRTARRLLSPTHRAWVLPALAVALGIAPTAVVAGFWGGSFRSLNSPEAALFYVFFAAVGLVVGFGFEFLLHADGD